jgi:hypothetical protein
VRETARLRGVCKALKALVMAWPMRLGRVRGGDVEAALTCFPAAEGFSTESEWPLAPAEKSRVVELLRRHGGTLKRVRLQAGGKQLHSAAVRAGALPSLTSIPLNLGDPDSRNVPSGGMLALLEEVDVDINVEWHVAALEHLRRRPHLRRLSLSLGSGALEAAFPPFIPPSLKTLIIDIEPYAPLEALLRQLPSMLQASGAGLEDFKMEVMDGLCPEGVAALAQVLRACSLTLKTLKIRFTGWLGDLVPSLVSCCDTLEVLHCPWSVFSALPATCPAFPRLNELHVHGGGGARTWTWRRRPGTSWPTGDCRP